MLERAIFRKHTKLFLFMASKQFFSQKELILFSLKNKEFKDKDSIENKGQFLDKLIKLNVIKKYKYRDFLKIHPEKSKDAAIAYKNTYERKRIILEFNYNNFLSLEFPIIKTKYFKNFQLPFKEYVEKIYDKNQNKIILENKDLYKKPYKKININEITNAFIFGCSLARIYFTKEEKIINLLKKTKKENNNTNILLINIAQKLMEEKIRQSII